MTCPGSNPDSAHYVNAFTSRESGYIQTVNKFIKDYYKLVVNNENNQIEAKKVPFKSLKN